jgi:hypothetical protein
MHAASHGACGSPLNGISAGGNLQGGSYEINREKSLSENAVFDGSILPRLARKKKLIHVSEEISVEKPCVLT